MKAFLPHSFLPSLTAVLPVAVFFLLGGPSFHGSSSPWARVTSPPLIVLLDAFGSGFLQLLVYECFTSHSVNCPLIKIPSRSPECAMCFLTNTNHD